MSGHSKSTFLLRTLISLTIRLIEISNEIRQEKSTALSMVRASPKFAQVVVKSTFTKYRVLQKACPSVIHDS